MNPSEYIISKQIAWVGDRGFELIGSQGDRGRKVYTLNIDQNLFRPLSKQARQDLQKGDGGELTGTANRPAKIQALHSSSTLGINVFDYWRDAE